MLRRIAFALALALAIWAAPSAQAIDRSDLSYEDNVTINIACHEAIPKGEDAFRACFKVQLDALGKHPSPDRNSLSAGRAQEIAANCAYLRRQGIGPYNDCLAKGVTEASAAAPEGDADDDDGGEAIAEKALVTEVAAPATVAEAALPSPAKALPPLPSAASGAPLAPAALYKRLERSIFVVTAAASPGDARAREIMQGSAVAVAPHLLLTNCHVVNHRPMIVLIQDEAIWHATLVAADVKDDRCVLKADGAPMTPVPGVRPYADIAVGEEVFALGAPHHLERTMTDGLVSGRRTLGGRNMIQTSAAVSPGSSGGGLFDARGNLLGITTLASLPGWQNLNFAVAAADFWE
jgi:S1-C subfamily serine protease